MKKRRRTRFAIPFVTTVALAPACFSAAAPGPEPQPIIETRPHVAPPVAPVAADPVAVDPAVANPRPDGDPAGDPPTGPTTEPVGAGDTAPVILANPPPPLPDPPEGARINKHADGTCWAYFVVKCPPNVRCNPPPPKQVKCAAE